MKNHCAKQFENKIQKTIAKTVNLVYTVRREQKNEFLRLIENNLNTI